MLTLKLRARNSLTGHLMRDPDRHREPEIEEDEYDFLNESSDFKIQIKENEVPVQKRNYDRKTHLEMLKMKVEQKAIEEAPFSTVYDTDCIDYLNPMQSFVKKQSKKGNG